MIQPLIHDVQPGEDLVVPLPRALSGLARLIIFGAQSAVAEVAGGEPTGGNLVLNGDFQSGDNGDWTLAGAQISITDLGGSDWVCSKSTDGAGNRAKQDVAAQGVQSAQTYRLELTVRNYNAGSFVAKDLRGQSFSWDTGLGSPATAINANGTYKADIVAGSGDNDLDLLYGNLGKFDFDDVVLRLLASGDPPACASVRTQRSPDDSVSLDEQEYWNDPVRGLQASIFNPLRLASTVNGAGSARDESLVVDDGTLYAAGNHVIIDPDLTEQIRRIESIATNTLTFNEPLTLDVADGVEVRVLQTYELILPVREATRLVIRNNNPAGAGNWSLGVGGRVEELFLAGGA